MTASSRSWACCGVLLLLLCLLLDGTPALAQGKHPAARWQALNAEVVAALDRGAYAEGLVPAERALALARSAFGRRNPRILPSLNNLAFLYANQGRSGKAEPLLKEA